jgi:hypothetical protein
LHDRPERRIMFLLMLTDEHPGRKQIEILRAMSGQDRLKVASQLY